MSYILDALKKAESDRKLGSVPNIHTHAVAAAGSDGDAPLWATPWMWAVFAALVFGLVAIAWRQPWQTAPVAIPTAALPAQTDVKTAEQAPPSAPPVATVTTAIATAPPAVEPAKPQPGPTIINESAENRPPQPVATTVARPDQTAVRQPESTQVTPAPAEPRIVSLRELPQNIQSEIPPLVFTGYIYSKNQAERSVVINDKLLREGDQVAPGLVLEKMTSEEVILSYKGYRYRLSY